MLPFSLSRWYGDCVSDSGEILAISAAELSWGPVHLRYQSRAVLEHIDWPPRRDSTLTSVTFPTVRHGVCSWHSERLGFVAEWEPRTTPIDRRVYGSKAGSVYMNVVVPSGTARVTLAGGKSFTGHGYLERIDLTLPPWDLPVTELRRGRFITSLDWAIWLDWQGPHRFRAARLNGADVVLGDVSADLVQLGAAVIQVGAPRLLRDGTLREGSIGAVSPILPLIPESALDIEERTRLCPAILRRPGEPEVTGWVVDQHLVWPKIR